MPSRLLWLSAFLALAWGAPEARAYPDAKAGTVSLSGQPLAVRVHPRGRYVYALHSGSGKVSVVDTLYFEETGSRAFSGTPRAMALSVDGTKLYVVTGAADQVLSIDLADPSAPAEPESLSVKTSGVTFDRIAVAGAAGSDRLVLASRVQKRICLFDVAEDALVMDGSDDHLALEFEPVALGVTPDRGRGSALGQNGKLRAFRTTSLVFVGGQVDLSSLTTAAFAHLAFGSVGGTPWGLAVNDRVPGEVFLLNYTNVNTAPALVDADPDGSGTDPVIVGDQSSAALVADVLRAKEQPSASATYLYVANEGDGTLSVVDTSKFGGSQKVVPIATIGDVAAVPSEGMAASSAEEGYLYAGDRAGLSLSVVTDQPFLTIESAPTDPVSGSTADVRLRSSLAATLTVSRYTGKTTEAVSPSSASVLVTADLAKETSATIAVPTADLGEGDNTIAFFAKSGEKRGRAAVTISKDTPPPTPGGFRVYFGDRKIIARWGRVDQADMSHYLVTFGTTSAATGGVPNRSSPQRVNQPEGGDLEYVIQPVENGTTVYVRITAVDKAGNASPPTEVLHETAEETIGLLGRSGESGGCSAASGLWLVPLLLFLASVRGVRRIGAAALVFAMVPAARAAEPSESAPLVRPRSSVEFRVAWWLPADAAVDEFYGGGNEIYQLRYGVLLGFFDVGIGGGILHETAPMLGATSGRASGEEQSLFMVPVEFSAQINGRFSSRQLAVPFARMGYDLVYFDVSEPGRSESGAKHAMSLTGGLRLNLEAFTSGNDLEDLLGIEHLFLEGLFTWRYQFSGGLDLGGFLIQPGLGVEF
jgi:DNA-binding beta-propeller fold protein YncE